MPQLAKLASELVAAVPLSVTKHEAEKHRVPRPPLVDGLQLFEAHSREVIIRRPWGVVVLVDGHGRKGWSLERADDSGKLPSQSIW